ncbi:unnamed protein product [Bursaphelenchus xylophilus]|uniref:DNA helicase n=1 Tax=Bursaphelenchus xylophilus TaxID=6326 RepID=A0A1I7SSD2_BURXY|nr:unnamed protein product [Bursaphelenchus xylophilus]CAG9097699.1 unnamed protein product [Bursaphelenchus xylophilus]
MDGLKRPHRVDQPNVKNDKRQKLDLPDTPIYIRVSDVVQGSQCLHVSGKRVDDLSEIKVILNDMWSYSVVKPGHLIAVMDVSNPFTNVLEVDMNEGKLVVEPLFLISPTVLTSVMFCERKAMLNERFKAAGTNRHMLLGCAVHEVFQTALEKDLVRPSKEDLQAIAEKIVLSKYSVDLVLLNEKLDSFMSDLTPYIENCSTWLKMHAPKPIGFSKPLDKQLHRISKISGIEHFISDKTLGLKGKIDVSFLAFNKSLTFPLELKTGKSAKSLEHQTQVFLYSLMLKYTSNEKQIAPGWILYLKDLQMFKVEPGEKDLIGVMHMRNSLASKLTDLSIDSFPPITKDPKFCEGCEQKLNCSLMNKFGDGTCKAKDSIAFMESLIEHLEYKELMYCTKWIRWHFMELGEQKKRNEENYLKDRTNSLDGYTVFSLAFENTFALMQNTPEMAKLRDIVIGFRKPRFVPLNHVPLTKIKGFINELDEDQRDAVVKCLRAEDFALVQGFPGAGKTTTMCAFLRSILSLRKTAIVSAHTNSAVDNILLKLANDVSPDSILRIGSQKSIHPGCEKFVLEYRLNAIADDGSIDNKEKMVKIKKLLMETPIIFTTCLMASSHALFSSRRFDYCVLDEASQVVENIALKPLSCADVFIMVGDINQLCPLVVNERAGYEGMELSLMERLLRYHDYVGEHTATLSKQYRMNKMICSLSSNMFYEGKLVCANKTVSEKVLEVLSTENNENINPEVVMGLVSPKLEDSVLFIDTYSQSYGSEFAANAAVGSRSRFNPGEASYVIRICSFLMESGLPSDEIGIASPYKGQIEYLLKKLSQRFPENAPECSTIDRYQGRDKSVMILSLVDGGPEGSSQSPDLLSDRKRLNVALTRAKKKLILVGCKETLSKSCLIEHLLNKISLTIRAF